MSCNSSVFALLVKESQSIENNENLFLLIALIAAVYGGGRQCKLLHNKFNFWSNLFYLQLMFVF